MRKVADSTQIVAIYKVVSQHCHRTSEGFAHYADGWDDMRIHKEVLAANPNWAFSQSSVNRVRRENFGNLKNIGRPGTDAMVKELQGQIEAMRLKLNQHETDMDELRDAYNKMVAYLRAKFSYQPPPGRPQSTPPDKPAH